jgi:hypothetical protein
LCLQVVGCRSQASCGWYREIKSLKYYLSLEYFSTDPFTHLFNLFAFLSTLQGYGYQAVKIQCLYCCRRNGGLYKYLSKLGIILEMFSKNFMGIEDFKEVF